MELLRKLYTKIVWIKEIIIGKGDECERRRWVQIKEMSVCEGDEYK